VKVAHLSKNECSAVVTRRIDGQWSIDLTYPVDQNNNKSAYLAENYRLRVYDNDTASYNTFLITTVTEQRTEKGSLIYQVSGDHIVIGLLSKKIINAFYDYKQETPANILTKILSYSGGYANGTVNPTTKIDLTIGHESVLSAILKLTEATGCYYDVDEPNTQIDVLASLGVDNQVRIEPKRNLKSLSRSIYIGEIINKMFATGSGEPPCTLSRTPHKVKSCVGAVVTFEGNKVIPINDIWNTNFKLKALNGADSGTAWTINDCTHGTTDDTMTLASSPAGLTKGDLVYITTSAGADVDYIPYTTGDKEGIFRDGDKQDNTNFVRFPMLDGTYSSGTCEGWSTYGSPAPTLTENTDATYIKYGQKSQRVQTTGKTTGIRQLINHQIAGDCWSVVVNVYLVSGSVTLALQADVDNGALISANSTGWQTLTLKNVYDSNPTSYIYILASTASSEFYVDSVWLMNSKDPKRFIDGSEKKGLWNNAFDELLRKITPRTTYQCNFVDLNRWNPERYPFDRISIGDTVRVIDQLLGIDIDQTVVEVRDNIFQPELTETVISNE
jgi:hypothetical protein